MNYRGATAGGFRRLARAIVACAVLCVGICMLAGCTSYPSVEDALKDADLQPTVSSGATLEPGVLTVGVNASNAPYAWPVTVGQTTVLDGIDVDVAVAMAERMGLTVKFVDVASDYEAAAKGLCDVVMGASTMTHRGRHGAYGRPVSLRHPDRRRLGPRGRLRAVRGLRLLYGRLPGHGLLRHSVCRRPVAA